MDEVEWILYERIIMGEEEMPQEVGTKEGEGSLEQRIATLHVWVQALEAQLRIVTAERDGLKAERDEFQVERDLVVISQQQTDQWVIEFTTTCNGSMVEVSREYARASRASQYYRDFYERLVLLDRREPTFLEIDSSLQGRGNNKTHSSRSQSRSQGETSDAR